MNSDKKYLSMIQYIARSNVSENTFHIYQCCNLPILKMRNRFETFV